MRKFIFGFIVCMISFICLSSCVTTARTYDYDYHPYNEDENVVVIGETCYVYYTNPTTLFLNSLHVANGMYFYKHINRYLPVVFPYWEVWSPHRYFYYDRNHWAWRDRHSGYNHLEYRRSQHWVDHRKPHPNNHQIQPKRDVRPNKPNHNNRPSHPISRSQNKGVPSIRQNRTRTTVNHGSFNGEARTQHRGRR